MPSIPARAPTGGWLWLATVVLVTLNLRPFLASIGPLAPAIQASTAMSFEALAWLTFLPMALIGSGTWLAPLAMRWCGARLALLAALLLLALGCALRLWPAWLLATAGVCGVGVALVQGMLPGLIKLHSPRHVAPMMGVYSASLMGGGALGAQLSPLALQWGLEWRWVLALWALPVLAAMALAHWQLGRMPAPAAAQQPTGMAWLLRRPRTWLLMLAFGLMNSGYASMVAWLAPYYQELGWSAARSGSLVAVLSLAQAAAALSLPLLAARSPGHDRRPWLWVTLGLQALGFALLAWQPLAAPLFIVVVLGVGLGGCFTFFMLVPLDHLPDPVQAGVLNALMQGGGFLLSALGPWALARLHDYGGWGSAALNGAVGSGFASGWWLHAVVVMAVALLALRFAPARYAHVMHAPGVNP